MSKTRRRRRRDGLPPAADAIIDELVPDPAARRAVREAARALADPALRRAYAAIAPGERAVLLLALRDAVRHLAARKPCDLCDAAATRIRPQVIGPESDFRGVAREDDRQAFVGLAVACGACAAMGPAAFGRAMLAKLARLQAAPGYAFDSHRRPALVGDRVGGSRGLPPRAELRACEGCSADVWVGRGAEIDAAGPRGTPGVLCRECAGRYAASGRLEGVPAAFVS
jgi:hypothetical protein